MGLGEALLTDLAIAVAVVIAVVVFIEPLRERRADRRFAEALREAKHQTEVHAAQALLDRKQAQVAADEEFALAEAQTGRGRRMPSREQIASVGYRDGHERLPMPEDERALQIALLESQFHHESRSPVAADTDPDAATSW